MAPHWLVRLNEFLTWLNPTLCAVATVLAVLVIVVANEPLTGKAASSTFQTAPPFAAPASVECTHVVLPPELRDLRLYD